MMWRYDAGADRLRAMIADGRFGKLISIEIGQFTSDVARRGPDHYLFDPEQSGRGFFNWLGCHWLDLVPYLTGEKVAAVLARVGNFGADSIALDDGGTAILETSSGTLVTLTGGYWLPRWTGELNVALRGSERWVHWEPAAPRNGWPLPHSRPAAAVPRDGRDLRPAAGPHARATAARRGPRPFAIGSRRHAAARARPAGTRSIRLWRPCGCSTRSTTHPGRVGASS